ncbi:ATP-binding cassette domain-containing protein, partial [Kibdelosporangium lantanae]
MLVADSLVKVFPGVRALDGASLRMEPGSVHALLGENGAGKSTLIKILTGVHRPDGGTLSIGGDEVTFDSPQAAVRAGIGVVHQERNLVPEFSVGENIVLQLTCAAPKIVPPEVKDAYLLALEASYDGDIGYRPMGHPLLRAAIAARYTHRGVPTTPDQILVTTGGQQALALLA